MIHKETKDYTINELIKKAKDKGKINPMPKNTIKINETRNESNLSNS
jgi:hypothetical protein